MKVDLDGLAANIKQCMDPDLDVGGWAYMVDEMVAHIKRLEQKHDRMECGLQVLASGNLAKPQEFAQRLLDEITEV
jgi:hypothetical protein